MSDYTITVPEKGYPPLHETCPLCKGSRYLISSFVSEDRLPTPDWCWRCQRRGWIPTSFGEEVLWIVDKLGGKR